MSDREIGFWWRPADKNASIERDGSFGFADIQPFVSQLTEPTAYLLVSLPNVNLDFTVLDDRSIEMEIMDSFGGGDHFAAITVSDAERVTQRAIEHWDTDSLRPLLSNLSLTWLT